MTMTLEGKRCLITGASGALGAAMARRLAREGAVLMEPLRETPFERFFFREPINGYVFEVVDQARARDLGTPTSSSAAR